MARLTLRDAGGFTAGFAQIGDFFEGFVACRYRRPSSNHAELRRMIKLFEIIENFICVHFGQIAKRAIFRNRFHGCPHAYQQIIHSFCGKDPFFVENTLILRAGSQWSTEREEESCWMKN